MSNVNHPDHYNQGGIECIDAIESAVQNLSGYEGYLIGNAIKYLWRHKQKGGVESLEKAIWHIEKQIEYLVETENDDYDFDFSIDYDDEDDNQVDVSIVSDKSIHDIIEILASALRDPKCK
jgi:hypothetical protein